MLKEQGFIQGDYDVTTDFELTGMVSGSVTVRSGVKFVLSGMVAESLVIEDGAKVEVFGMIGGDVINHGGELQIDGLVAGESVEVSTQN